MTYDFKDHFSRIAKTYRAFRPDYPEELFRWLAYVSPRQEAAVDCGCGTGQAAVALTGYFEMVYAVDPSQEQIANSIRHERVIYLVASAETTGLPQESQDLIIAAQSLHWFDLDRFYLEVHRLARKDAIFAAFTYGLVTVNQNVDKVISHLYLDILANYWPPERSYVDEGYRTLPFPFREIVSPVFEMTANWGLDHLLGYLATWSAVKEYKDQTGEDPLNIIEEELREIWGNEEDMKGISWPLVMRAGSIN